MLALVGVGLLGFGAAYRRQIGHNSRLYANLDRHITPTSVGIFFGRMLSVR